MSTDPHPGRTDPRRPPARETPAATASTLRDLAPLPAYRSGTDDLIGDFYVPCLRASVRYDRATAYFDTKAFALGAPGLARFVANGGRMRLVVSPRLRPRDVAALTGRRAWSVDRSDSDTGGAAPAAGLAARLRADPAGGTSWLVRTGRLRVKVAFLRGESVAPFGHYHEKLGVFVDPVGDVVAFAGSLNETGLAWDGNVEAVDVFRSWRAAERPRVDAKVAAFDDLWSDAMPGVAVKPIEVALEDGVGLGHVWRSIKAALAGRLPVGSDRSVEDRPPEPGADPHHPDRAAT